MHSMECTSTGVAAAVDVRRVYDDLIRFETQLWDMIDVELRDAHELSLAWFEVLQVVERVTGCRVVDIVQALSITVGGASKLVDRIERAGLCTRSANPDDRRSSILTLTSHGTRVLLAARATFSDRLQHLVVAPLTADELTMFADVLARLRQHTGRPSGEPR
jgi:DNA-binding MarR family transcriptional regulator